MPATTLPPPTIQLATAAHRRTLALLCLSGGQLLLWLGTALHNFYGGMRLLVVPVQPWLKFGAGHRHPAALVPSPVGWYSTGTLGRLSYHPTALSDYFLFYRIGNLSGLDALFLAGVGAYLYRALGRRPGAGVPAPRPRRALELVGLTSLLMYVLSMAVDVLAREVFQAKTQQLFTLAGPSGVHLFYPVLGMLLGICSQFAEPGPPRPSLAGGNPALTQAGN